MPTIGCNPFWGPRIELQRVLGCLGIFCNFNFYSFSVVSSSYLLYIVALVACFCVKQCIFHFFYILCRAELCDFYATEVHVLNYFVCKEKANKKRPSLVMKTNHHVY